MFLLGFWGAAFSSVLGVYHGVPFLFDDMLHLWRRTAGGGQQGTPYRAWAAYLALAAISALVIRRPVWLVFAYTVVGSMFFPFVISTLLWLNNSRNARATRNGVFVNVVLGAALALYAFLAVEAFEGGVMKGSRPPRLHRLPRMTPRSPFPSSISFRSAAEPLHARRCRSRWTCARLAERLGFVRYWFAEHHGMASIASSVPRF